MVALLVGSTEPTAQMSDGELPAIAARTLSLEPMLGVGTCCHFDVPATAGAAAAGGRAAPGAAAVARPGERAGPSDAPPNSLPIGTTFFLSQVRLRQLRPNACWIVDSRE